MESRVLIGADREVALWVQRLCGAKFAASARAFGVTRGGRLVAGVVFDRWLERDANIEMSAAARGRLWLDRYVIDVVLGYPFRQLGCLRVTASVVPENTRARRILERLGFEKEGLVRNARVSEEGEPRDVEIWGLLRETWDQRWASNG